MALALPIAAGESEFNRYDFLELAPLRLLRRLVPWRRGGLGLPRVS